MAPESSLSYPPQSLTQHEIPEKLLILPERRADLGQFGDTSKPITAH